MKTSSLKILTYFVAAILSFAQIFIGEYIPFIIILSSLWAFIYFSFTKEIDLYLIFLFLLPIITNSGVSAVTDVDSTDLFWFKVPTTHGKSILILWPLALSNTFALALAVPLRLLFFYKKIKNKFLLFPWFLALILSVLGLAVSLIIGMVNPSGLTVGLRIALSTGCLFVPLFINEEEFVKSVKWIFNSSMILLLLGILYGHWTFILAGFIPFMVLSNKKVLLLLSIISMLILLLGGSTFTIQLSILVAFTLILFSIMNLLNFRKSVVLPILLSSIPLLITIFALNTKSDIYTKDVSGNYIEKLSYKFFDDRKPLWDATYKQISNSIFWFAPAGRPTQIEDYWVKDDEWTPGAHNIFLEIPRQIGNFGGLLIEIILFFFIIKIGLKNNKKEFRYLYFSFISVFIVYGLVGNSLVYDGIGFLYWLLVGQFYNLKFKHDLQSASH